MSGSWWRKTKRLGLALAAASLASCEPPTIIAAPTDDPVSQGSVSLTSEPAPWAALADVEVDHEGELVAWLNEARAVAGLEPVAPHQSLREAAQSHATFLVTWRDAYAERGLSAHVQPADLPGFVGESFIDRVAFFGYTGHAYGEVVAFKPSSVAAARSWMETVYHRLPLLHPAVDEVGYGQVHDEQGYANVLEMGIGGDLDAGFHLVRWPAPDAAEVPFAWDGKEIPQPPAPPAGYPSGPVITLQVFGATFDEADATVRLDAADAAPLPATTLTWPDDPKLGPDAIAVIPHAPLAPETRYRVEITGTLDGEAFVDEWTFTTRHQGCDPVAQGCGPGKGCYVIDGTPRCLWAGTLSLDAGCEHTNECAAGLTCFASRCRPLCDLAPSAVTGACGAHCQSEIFDLGGDDDGGSWGLCLPPPCALDANSCDSGESCAWAGSFVCAEPGAGAPGAACGQLSDCGATLACLGLGEGFQCHQLCGAEAYPDCEDACPGASAPLDLELGVRYCGAD